ncbi:MAG: hypothetical protein L6Q95_01560 [Planctomycetes bacterium]|nr:hypothetical protein [Planctomycetota bacterium]
MRASVVLKLQLLMLCSASGCHSCNGRETAAISHLEARQSAYEYCCDPEKPDPPEGYPGCEVTFDYQEDGDSPGDELWVTPVPNLNAIVNPDSFAVGPLSPRTIEIRVRHCVDSLTVTFEVSLDPPGAPLHDVKGRHTITLRRVDCPPTGGGTTPVPIDVTGPEGLLRMRPEFAHNRPGDGALPLPPHSMDIIVGGDNGWAIVNPETGATIDDKGLQLGFPNFGVLPLGGSGADDTAFGFGPLNSHLTEFIPASQEFGPTLIIGANSNHTDGCLYGDGTSLGGVFVNYTLGNIRLLRYNPSGFFEVSTDWITDAAFGSDPGKAVSACADSPTAPVYIAVEGSPGSLYVHQPADRPSGGAATRLGDTGDAPRRVRKIGDFVVVSNHESDSLTVALASTNTIVGTVPVGDGPVGIDLMLIDDNLAVASTGFNDNTFTITILDPAGAVVSNETKPLPDGCTGPGHIIFWKSGVLASCKTSNNLIYVEVPELLE